MNCCKVVNDGNTDWLRFKCSAALLSVESEMLLDMLALAPPLAPARAATLLPTGLSTGAEAGAAEAPSASMEEAGFGMCSEWGWLGVCGEGRGLDE